MGGMDVLVFSTVPQTAPGAEPVEVFTHPRELGGIVSGALEDLAEAGLTVTGPSVVDVHPLARHISRSAVVYRFARGEGYTARHLIEFAPWATARNCVFRVGDGPFRNLDGENLQAPGREVKVPVHVDAHSRRLRNLRSLRRAGLEPAEQIPVIPAEAEVQLRDSVEVVYRLGALAVVTVTARHILDGTFPPADEVLGELELVGPALTPRERSFLDEVGQARRSLFDAPAPPRIPRPLRQHAGLLHRSCHAVEALSWALQITDLPPGRTRAWDFDPEVWKGVSASGPAEEVLRLGTAALLVQAPGLRGLTQLLEAFDLVHILHHGLAEGEGGLPVIAEQWTRALAWLCAPWCAWGEAERLL
ncbi:DUF4272 domain-containing protein [Corynebacterium sp. YIM 101645]|uniref:DUF4272 domain-containing protein n=1 Tax=Corynebacterium lemuris TaxID=1859292 RepID=A0ABT2FWZ0_9CORY|nr:DUF4272 domain-containing protein [Corynebacterium lemuris]MCS5479753.1 DUF4272 domain-containing protein [Corynebacterium lemuris]